MAHMLRVSGLLVLLIGFPSSLDAGRWRPMRKIPCSVSPMFCPVETDQREGSTPRAVKFTRDCSTMSLDGSTPTTSRYRSLSR